MGGWMGWTWCNRAVLCTRWKSQTSSARVANHKEVLIWFTHLLCQWDHPIRQSSEEKTCHWFEPVSLDSHALFKGFVKVRTAESTNKLFCSESLWFNILVSSFKLFDVKRKIEHETRHEVQLKPEHLHLTFSKPLQYISTVYKFPDKSGERIYSKASWLPISSIHIRLSEPKFQIM